MADLAPLGYGRVKARYVAGVADSNDAGDVPDVVPLTGTVTFNMSAPALRVVTAVPDPATVHPRPITVALDDEGYLTQNGSRLVSLLATDDPATNPTGLQWTVSFNLRTIDGDSVPAPAWSFELPRGAVVDLTEVAPLAAPAPNTIILKGLKGDKGDTGQQGPQGLPGAAASLSLVAQLAVWAMEPDLLISGVITRNSTGTATSAPVVWPDGTPGTFTALVISPTFGTVDSYTVTYGSPVTKTFTQPTITRDSVGAASNRPQIVVS